MIGDVIKHLPLHQAIQELNLIIEAGVMNPQLVFLHRQERRRCCACYELMGKRTTYRAVGAIRLVYS